MNAKSPNTAREQKKQEIPRTSGGGSRLPVLLVTADTTGEAWIKALRAVWDHGIEIPNHYEKELSKEATVQVNVLNPLKEPRIHKADYVGVSDIVLNPTYVDEVLKGTKDHKVDEGSLSYTYHRRIWNWGKPVKKHDAMLKEQGLPRIVFDGLEEHGIDQMDYLLTKATEEYISRKLQVTTWQPHKDLVVSGAPCYDKETEVLTKDGWKLFKDLNDKESVLTLNPETNEMIYQDIVKKISYEHKGKMLVHEGHNSNFSVTPNHEMFIERRRVNERALVRADQLPHEFYLKRSGTWNGIEQETFDLNGKKISMDEWLRFLAIYLCDGSTTMNSNPEGQKHGRYRSRITQKRKKDQYRRIVNAIATQLEMSVAEKDDVHCEGAIHFTFHSKDLNTYFKQFGRSSQKFVPSFIKGLSSRQIRIFLDAFQLGDSSKRGQTIRYDSTAKKMIDDLQELVLKSGNDSGADIWSRKDKEYYELKERIFKKGLSVAKKEIAHVDYDDVVYCVEVPKYHVIHVRRKGKPMWCGNCLQRLWFRIISGDDGKTPESLVLQTTWRSRDLTKAWGSNAYAMVEIGKWVAERLSERFKTKITLTQYVDVSNSLHIYGSDYSEVEKIFSTLAKRNPRKNNNLIPQKQLFIATKKSCSNTELDSERACQCSGNCVKY